MTYLSVNELQFRPGKLHFFSSSKKEKINMIAEATINYYSVEMYVKGCAKIWIDTIPYEFETGSIFIRKPGMSIKQDKNFEYESYALGFQIIVKETGEQLLSSEDFYCFLDQLPAKIAPENFADFLHVVREIPDTEPISVSEKDDLAANAILNKVLYLLYPFNREAERKEPYVHPAVKKAISFFKTNADTPVTMKEAAEYAGISEKYFQQLFKEYTGKTPNNYFIDYRMKIAVRKLLTTDMSVAEIAYESGFSSCAYFSQLFKKIYQKTPSEFRKGSKFKQ